MRRFITAMLLALFVCQSSGAAVAAPAAASNAPSLLAQIQFAFSQTLSALQTTHIGAFLTGKEHQYEAMHAAPPDFSEARKPHEHANPNLHPPLVTPVYHPGLPGHVPAYPGPPDLKNIKPDPLAMKASTAQASTAKRSAQHNPVALPRPMFPSQQRHSVAPMTVGAGNGSGTTGINRWWTYEEGALPGVGKWMVNVATGNLIIQEDDIDLPERGIDLAFRRTYNSQSQHDYANTDGTVPSNFGNGWTNTFDAHLSYNSSTNVMTIYDIDGARYDYTSDGQGHWIAPPGMQGTNLFLSGACGYDWQKKNGTIYVFWLPYANSSCGPSADAGYRGRPLAIFGRNYNNEIRFDYYWDNGDASSAAHLNEINVVHSDGQTLMLKFADFNGYRELSYFTRPDGVATSYQYDSSGDLASVTLPGNNSGTTEVNYGWNSGHQIHWIETPRWYQSNGTSGGFMYINIDGSSRATGVQLSGFDNFTPNDGTGQALQPALGQSAQVMSYTAFSYPSGSETQLTDTDGHATNWFYDGSGRTTETQEWTGAPNNLWLTTYASWDGSNNLTESVDARGNATDYGYDGNGNTIWTQAPWITTSMGYGRPVARYSYDQYNNLVAYCDPQYIWTTGATSCNAGSGVTHYTWNYSDSAEPYGYLTDTYTPLGYHHGIGYNNSWQAGGDYKLPTDIVGDCMTQADGTSRCPHTQIVYDGYGNVVCYSAYQDTGSTVRWFRAAYDNLNRRTATADADDGSLSVPQCSNTAGLAGSHVQSTTSYYQNGQVSATQSPSEYAAGVSSTYSYDADGNEISEVHHHNGVAGTTNKWYDGADRLVEVRQPTDGSDVYGFSWLTRYIYDLSQNGTSARPTIGGQTLLGYGNLVATQECLATTTVTAPYGSKPTSCTFTGMEIKGQTFDALDRLVKKYAWSGNNLYTETLNYGGSGEAGLLSSDCKTSSATTLPCTAYSYNTFGQISTISHNDNQVTPDFTYTYDPDSRTTSVAHSAGGGAQTYAYDQDGRLTQTVEPSSMAAAATLTYHYYADGMRQSLDVTSSALTQAGLFYYAYRSDGKLQWEQVTDNALPSADTAISYTYTPAGRETALHFSGAGTPAAAPSYSYDTYGRLSTQTLNSNIRAFSMGYDAEGEINSYLVPNATSPTQNDTWQPQYSSRGELTTTLENGTGHEQYSFANGVALQLKTSASTTASVTFDARMGVVTGSVGSKCLTTGSGTGCPSMNATFDGLGRMTLDVNQTPEKDDLGDIYYNSTNATNSYDSANRLLSTTTTQTKGINSVTSAYSAAAYKWGPNGHPMLVGTTCCASTTVSASDTLHWDGDQLLFTTNSSGAVDDIKVGTLADITPGDSLYSGITFLARAADHSVEACYNTSGAEGYLAFGGTRTPGTGCSGAGSMSIPKAFGPGAYSHLGVGAGRALMYWRTDGLYDGINTIQGVRNFNSDIGGWTTPDAYAGDVHDPMSQKSYVWNGNNPVAYSDPSGYYYGENAGAAMYGDALSAAEYEHNEADTSLIAATDVPDHQESLPPEEGANGAGEENETEAKKIIQGERYLKTQQKDIDDRLGVPEDAPNFAKGAERHIFRNAPGHFEEDSAGARAIIRRAASFGRLTRLQGNKALPHWEERVWYHNGFRIWVQLFKGEINNAGIMRLPMTP